MPDEQFTDHYETLEISPTAHPETIHRVYRLLAQLYHPDNASSGSVEQFKRVLEAYRVLSDPMQRAAYDLQHRTNRQTSWRVFGQGDPVQGIASERAKRNAVLTALYAKRVSEPEKPGMNIIELEHLLGCSREHMELTLWYLRESGRISRTDNSRYILTSKGFETLEEEANGSAPPSQRALPAPLHPANELRRDSGTPVAN